MFAIRCNLIYNSSCKWAWIQVNSRLLKHLLLITSLWTVDYGLRFYKVNVGSLVWNHARLRSHCSTCNLLLQLPKVSKTVLLQHVTVNQLVVNHLCLKRWTYSIRYRILGCHHLGNSVLDNLLRKVDKGWRLMISEETLCVIKVIRSDSCSTKVWNCDWSLATTHWNAGLCRDRSILKKSLLHLLLTSIENIGINRQGLLGRLF